MHEQNIVHRDLKPENILVSSRKDNTIKITDFGFATYFDSKKKLDVALGSPYFMSPEIASG